MKTLTFSQKISFYTLFSFVLSGVRVATADDTEVFFTSTGAISPNVLFIMDNSSSMSEKINGETRIDIMKETLTEVLGNVEDNLNVGIMNYGSAESWRNDRGNGVKFPVKPLNTLVKPIIEESLKDKAGEVQWRHHRQPAPAGNGMSSWFNPVVDNFDAMTVRDYLPEVAKTWEAEGNTPIVDALVEAALYFRGGAIRWEDTTGYGGRGHYFAAAHPSTYQYPDGVYFKSAAFPGHDFPYTPQWYADNLSSAWSPRSVDEKKWYFKYFKPATADWFTGWIRCPNNTGWPNYKPLKNTGESTLKNCRIMRNDFVKYLQDEFGSVFNTAVNGINQGNKKTWWVDKEVKKAIRQITSNQLRASASKVEEYKDKKVFHFDRFPRCRVAEEVLCVDDLDTSISYYDRRNKYKCTTEDSEACRTWDYEQCENPDDQRIVNEVICDFDQNTSRYPDPNYISPIVGDCQSNFIVLMSDGKPEYSEGDRLSIKAKSSTYYTNVPDMIGKSCKDDPYFKAGTCGPDLTHYLATHDNLPGKGFAVGDQFINTMVIGFSNTVTDDANTTAYLESLVTIENDPKTEGRDGFFLAEDKASLVEAFTKALKEVVVAARSQASPGYSVNVKSGLEHEDDIYIPVFEKNSSEGWSGNLKKFKLVNVDGHRRIRGKTTGVDAMTELGLIKDEAWDFWSKSTKADGNSVTDGGVASLIDKPAERKLFSNITDNKNLWAEENVISQQNANITKDMVGATETVTTEAYKKKLINFIRGWKKGDTSKDARQHMGDMLHSEPVIVTYKNGDKDGVGKEQYIFAATNEGYIHAFDTETGEEKFAFMPKQLLKNIEHQFVGDGNGNGEHIYGIDGPLTYVKDGSNVYLYFGLRRGGRAYYALDVSDVTKPKLMWKIDGANGGDFARLGQAWSQAYLANVKVGREKKTALIFSGGNDTKFDYGISGGYDENSVKENTMQADLADDIYIVNAKTGERIWSMRESMQNTDVKHAIPAAPRVLDTNNNGYIDRMYFSDTGGNVWRLNLYEDLSDPTKSSLIKLAELSEDGENARKFYNEPDIARLTHNGQTIFTVSIGSGLRPHPINKKINDYMFVLLDKAPLSEIDKTIKPFKQWPIKINKLANVEIETSIQEGTGKVSKTLKHSDFKKGEKTVKQITESDKFGWYVQFSDPGEKVLASSITFEGSLVFTTLVPAAITSGELINACESPGTQGRIYAMNILTGEASLDLNRDGSKDDNDVFNIIAASEIPGKPQRIFNKLDCSSGSCKHEVDIRIGKKSSEVSFENVSRVESIYWQHPK